RIKPQLYASLWMSLSIALWALMEFLGRVIPAGYSPYQTVWVRYATHLLFMMTVWGPRYKTSLIRTPHWGMQIVRALLMLGMPFFFITAIYRMPLDDALAVFWISPLLVMGFALL